MSALNLLDRLPASQAAEEDVKVTVDNITKFTGSDRDDVYIIAFKDESGRRHRRTIFANLFTDGRIPTIPFGGLPAMLTLRDVKYEGKNGENAGKQIEGYNIVGIQLDYSEVNKQNLVAALNLTVTI